jgi:Putative transposase/Transposase zinc-binding domain
MCEKTYPLGEIMRLYGPDFVANNHCSVNVIRTFRDIARCRTGHFGGRKLTCDCCGHEVVLMNSCGNRNCPTCQAIKKEIWIDKKMIQLLPVRHFHVVFTLPHELNDLILNNGWDLYNILFRSVWQTIKQLCADEKQLGAAVGMIAALHTWSSSMMHHPHVHCIVPAGGIDENDDWKDSKRNGTFFIRVSDLGKTFKGIYLNNLLQWIDSQSFEDDKLAKIREVLKVIKVKKWNVHTQEPMSGVKQVVDYLARYVYRSAITNSRILDYSDGKVTFKYKKYAESNSDDEPVPEAVMTVSATEFLRRFAMHILPSGFQRIRYYGFYASAAKNKLNNLRSKLLSREWCVTVRTVCQIVESFLGFHPDFCPGCGSEKKWVVAVIEKIPQDFALTKDLMHQKVRPPPKEVDPSLY